MIRDKTELSKFEMWLREKGCEIQPNTNEYEVLRWKGKGTGVIYRKKHGRYTHNSSYAKKAIWAFRKNKSWDGGPVNTGRFGSYRKKKAKLLERDGTKCFYCGEEMGDDITLEHIMPLNQGGPNSFSNFALCHEACNSKAGHLNIVEKVRMAIEERSKNKS